MSVCRVVIFIVFFYIVCVVDVDVVSVTVFL